MKEFRVSTTNYDTSISFDLSDKLIFMGSNHELKWQVYQLMKRGLDKKRLDDIEYDYYGQDGISIFLDDKRITSRNVTTLCIEKFNDIIDQFSLSKSTLMDHQLTYLSQNYEIDRKIKEINNQLLSLESSLNLQVKDWSDTFNFQLDSMNFIDFIRKNSNLRFVKNDQYVPYYSLPVNEYIDEFINLLKFYINDIGQEIWLIFYCPETIFSYATLQFLLDELSKLAQESHLLKYFIFHNHIRTKYIQEDINSIVICHDSFDQLPDYYNFRNSIERHYPIELNISDSELLSRLNRILCEIGNPVQDCSLGTRKDMVLLKVLNEILGIEESSKTLLDDLSQSEIRYLTR